MMLSKNKIKFIQSLNRKKNRDQERAYLVEGDKMVTEAIRSAQDIKLLCATRQFLGSVSVVGRCVQEVIEVTGEELQKASLLESPQNALAIVRMPETTFEPSLILNDLSLALDFIQDPGNLGTIIRVADWFGIRHLLCSGNTVDCYNPKVIQASMGAIFRVQLHYLDLVQTLKEAQERELPVFGTFLEGKSIYQHPLGQKGVLVMGNEGNGISPEVGKNIREKLFIPSFPADRRNSESLNVATATAICCAEFRRRMLSR